MIINKCKSELQNHIIPFWNSLADVENGGFYGHMDYNLVLNKNADKGVILNSRILWFYSESYKILGGEENRRMAEHAYKFLKNHCIDKEFGGVFWMCDYKGNPSDTMKHTYNQAFAIYALSCYYNAFKCNEALDIAFSLFETIEEKTLDEFGYREAFSQEWELIDNEALSENGLKADKTMNTVLHLIEAYTELIKAKRDKRVEDRLRFLINIMTEKVYEPSRKALKVFFDHQFNEIGGIHSYGHDIEATWLVDLACQVLGDDELTKKCRDINLTISKNILDIALENNALNNESENGRVDKKRVWWVQAEAVVGFTNAFEQSSKTEFLDAAKTIWNYIEDNMIDNRLGGEWYSELDFDGTPRQEFPIVGPWKCPYHNGRMCLEIIRRNVH